MWGRLDGASHVAIAHHADPFPGENAQVAIFFVVNDGHISIIPAFSKPDGVCKCDNDTSHW